MNLFAVPNSLARTLLALLAVLGTLACGSRANRGTVAENSSPGAVTPASSVPASEPPRADPVPASTATPSTDAAVVAAAAAESANPFDRLRGQWLRPDGGYILEIASISQDGRAEASYRNPRPINVSRAQASRDGGGLSLFVELRDVNYPGSTYRLAYVPSRDVLEGQYFQALQQQTFDVAFVRAAGAPPARK